MAETEKRDWTRVASVIRRRRGQLGYRRQEDIATAAGVSVETWRDLENARRTNYKDITLSLVSTALGWPPDTLDRVAAGEHVSIPEDQMVPAKRLDELERRLDRLEAAVDRLLAESDDPPAQ